ncbi:MAG: recombinase family protein [Lachnospiraceae bacterium]|nr:recombinase family protein [Lachnospiraceae bacterium]
MTPTMQQTPILFSRSNKDNYTQPIRVAIYGRVSTEHEEQLSAFDNQMEWYSMLLKTHPNWNVVRRPYSDKSTGTNTKKRDDFNQMIDDAMNGQFDLIITREVCRFARNTIDSLFYTRMLKNKKVEVYFVNDGIWSLDSDGELRLTIIAALAQDESRKISERVRAGQLISRENGILYGYNAFGYKHVKGEKSKDSHYILDVEDSATVRRIFDLYLAGYGMKAICSKLIEEGRKNASGLVKFDCTQISRILDNKLYAGFVVYNKSYKEDFLGKRIVNHDKSTYQYIKSDKVIPIITEEEYQRVQEIKNSRKKSTKGKAQCKRESTDRYTRKLVCSCGKSYQKFKWHVLANGTKVWGYQCRNIINNKSAKFRAQNGQSTDGYCSVPSVCQWKLDFMLDTIVKELWENPAATINKLLEIVSANYSTNNDNEEKLKRIQLLNDEIGKVMARKQALEMKWLDGKLNDADHERLCGVLNTNIETYQAEISALTNLIEDNPDSTDLEEKMNNIRLMEQLLLDGDNLTRLNIDDTFIDTFVARITPCEGRKFKWYLNIGSGRGWGFFSETAYELYDYFSLSYSQAQRYRKEHNQYLRKNQWEDITVEIYIRTN